MNNALFSKFGTVNYICSSLDVSARGLNFLKDMPEEIEGDFDCGYNELISLQGAPKKVGGYYDCSYNHLISLEGAPKKVGRFFSCKSNSLLISLKGAPEEVGEFFDCSYTDVGSLEGAPKKCKALYCMFTKITKKQAIDYLRYNDCEVVIIAGERIYKKDIVKKLAVE